MAKKVKTLVITVDRDDDLGKKTSLSGPILGEKHCLKAAETLAIADPGESDANAMFAAIKTYRELKNLGESVDVAIITGNKDRGIKADREVARQLEELKEKLGFEDVVLVSDGADDEQLIPVIQGITRIANIQRVVIKQSQAIESSFYLIKEALKDPYFARFIFGLPGIAMLIYAIVYLLGVEKLGLNIILGLLGLYLILKGFGIEDALVNWISSFKKTASFERASFPVYLSVLFILILAVWAGIDSSRYYSTQLQIMGMENTAVSIIAFFLGGLGLFTLAVLLFYIGRMIDMFHRGEVRKIRSYARSAVTIISGYLVLDISLKYALSWASQVFPGPTFVDVLIVILVAILVTFFGFSVISRVYRKFLSRHIKRGMVVRRENREIGKVSGVDSRKGVVNVLVSETEKTQIPLGKVRILEQNGIEVL